MQLWCVETDTTHEPLNQATHLNLETKHQAPWERASCGTSIYH